MYFVNFHCHTKYGILCWGNSIDAKRVFTLQKKVIRIICGAKYRDECTELFKILNFLTLTCVFILESAMKVKNNIQFLSEHKTIHRYSTRNLDGIITPMYCRTEMYKSGPCCSCLTIYNNLPLEIRLINDIKMFESSVKVFLMNKQFYSVQKFTNECHKNNVC
jgi:hypothetical protein